MLRRDTTGVVAALPPALFSVWHNVTGPALASYFSRNEPANSESVAATPTDD